MLSQFKNYIKSHHLCSANDKILLTISGGADSVTLLHLFKQSKYKIGLAHCNFKLRGKESDGDEAFVKQLAEKYNINSHFISFNTSNFANENKLSIEMAARKLRYNWFNELCNQHNYTKIATGHHLNDSIETLFINMARGTGINGILGIKPKKDKVIRPLLFASREQIENYIEENKLDFKKDSSNESNEFVRNLIRNEVIPKFKEINPSFEETMQQNLLNFSDAASIFNAKIADIKIKLLQVVNNQVRIAINNLLKQNHVHTLLYEMLATYNFTFDTVQKVIAGLKGEPGKIFHSVSHKLLIDREFIIIEELNKQVDSYFLESFNDFNKLPIKLSTTFYNYTTYKLIKDQKVACLDADLLGFPMILRKWKQGDWFYPLGMKNKKKLSDFFIDQKIDRFTKEHTWILESKSKIIWVIGLRIDDRFKVTENTTNILQLNIKT